ncbi:hypothetical protein M0R45_008943 [Rubus argutus]|uniref:Uncharacterized protein n=1 Tax=Rubus argutus TaxID=59490 RepID=A0AAW1Y5Z8_RUBAR
MATTAVRRLDAVENEWRRAWWHGLTTGRTEQLDGNLVQQLGATGSRSAREERVAAGHINGVATWEFVLEDKGVAGLIVKYERGMVIRLAGCGCNLWIYEGGLG